MSTSCSTFKSPRVQQVATWFDLRLPPPRAISLLDQPPLPDLGQILLITGPSGSGKSRLLRSIRRRTRRTMRWINLPAIRLPDRPVVDCFGSHPLEQTLELLNRVGLAEAWTYLRHPKQLSDGQRWRLRLALALHSAQVPETSDQADPDPEPVEGSGPGISRNHPPILIADEFAALLDRITAAIVARALRRTIDAHPHLRAIIATSHDDLKRPLQPELHVRCDFGDSSTQRRRVEDAEVAEKDRRCADVIQASDLKSQI